MKETSSVPKYKRRWQVGIYIITALFMARDVFLKHYGYGFNYITDLFDTYKQYFLLVALSFLGISLFLLIISPRLGTRAAIVAAYIGFVFYFGVFVINLVGSPYFYFDVFRFYLPPIFLLGTMIIYSQKILQLPAEQVDLLIPMLFFKFQWTPKIQQYVLSGFIIVFGILSIQWLHPRASCAISGGEWTRGGIMGQQYCVHSYPDAGKACQSSDDCMGSCLANTISSGETKVVLPVGKCAPDDRVFGCFEIFENQEIQTLCVD